MPCEANCCNDLLSGKPITRKWPVKEDVETLYPVLQFDSAGDFFDRFFADHIQKSAGVTFNNFRRIGCWNWVLDWPEAEYFRELVKRYKAAKNFGVGLGTSFDNTSIRLLENLLLLL